MQCSLAVVSSFLIVVLIQSINCFPDGAKEKNCGDMMPHHKDNPIQTDASPYNTIPEKTMINVGEKVKLTLKSKDEKDAGFKGFMVMAFGKENLTLPIGSFIVDEVANNSKSIDCPGNSKMNALTHNSNTLKKSVTITWTPPANFEGDVIFKTTYVKEFTTFWHDAKSAQINVMDMGGDGGASQATVFGGLIAAACLFALL